MTSAEASEDRPSLVRLTLNLIPKSAEALEHAAAVDRNSKTDTVNRAIQLYDFFLSQQAKGGRIYLRQDGSDEMERIRLL